MYVCVCAHACACMHVCVRVLTDVYAGVRLLACFSRDVCWLACDHACVGVKFQMFQDSVPPCFYETHNINVSQMVDR